MTYSDRPTADDANVTNALSEITGLFAPMFRRNRCDETILLRHETIFRFPCRYPETALGYEAAQPDGGRQAGDRSMRTFSFILAFAFVLAGPSMAGSPDSLPAAGAFAYNGAPAANSVPFVLAAR
jgi:hypothetical protein